MRTSWREAAPRTRPRWSAADDPRGERWRRTPPPLLRGEDGGRVILSVTGCRAAGRARSPVWRGTGTSRTGAGHRGDVDAVSGRGRRRVVLGTASRARSAMSVTSSAGLRPFGHDAGSAGTASGPSSFWAASGVGGGQVQPEQVGELRAVLVRLGTPVSRSPGGRHGSSPGRRGRKAVSIAAARIGFRVYCTNRASARNPGRSRGPWARSG